MEQPRKETIRPQVLSKEEVNAIIGSINNLKHKCMIMTACSLVHLAEGIPNAAFRMCSSVEIASLLKQIPGAKWGQTILRNLNTYYDQKIRSD
jgi:hypothetical protein